MIEVSHLSKSYGLSLIHICTLRGRQEWNGMMVANIMKNERRWGDLEARKSIVVDYKLGKVTKMCIRDRAYHQLP